MTEQSLPLQLRILRAAARVTPNRPIHCEEILEERNDTLVFQVVVRAGYGPLRRLMAVDHRTSFGRVPPERLSEILEREWRAAREQMLEALNAPDCGLADERTLAEVP